MTIYSKLSKFVRYIIMYGVGRSLAKAGYQLNESFLSYLLLQMAFARLRAVKKQRLVIVGLGMHGFSTVAYFLSKNRYQISVVIDPSEKSSWLSRRILKAKHYTNVNSAIDAGEFYGDVLFIVSDHATHLKYANLGSASFRSIYIEKPLITKKSDVGALIELVNNSSVNLFTGYNRPKAPFFTNLTQELYVAKFNCSMFVNGHFLDKDHWYRDTDQGSRVLGNCTHWIDLAYRLLIGKGKLTQPISVFIDRGIDDSVTIKLQRGDSKVVYIHFAAFLEPRNGVEEYIYWNSDKSLGNIINFQTFKIEDYTNKTIIRRFRKDVGHGQTILAALGNGPRYIDRLGLNSAILAIEIENAINADETEIHYIGTELE